ncbi:hypothetical protein BDZ94DRAFT_1237698 [Collybia nuda]|uniref:DUF6534 domain-containing protein n=1 Tax=Collybia nuda TaxID=64659 RepID=A0A9P5Y361_9AGAR|nr:hypothetical protein BDZ94DRAFT_1237698 [Collybia nuda]
MPSTLDLDDTFGAFLIGVVVSAALFGVMCNQTFYYFQNYSCDSLHVKVFVTLADSIWSVTILIPLSSAIIFLVHMFYIKRLYLVSHKNMFLPPLVVSNYFITYKISQSPYFYTIPELVPYMTAALTLSMAADICISGSLSFLLHKGRSGIKRTDTMINRLIMYTVNNGILTSILIIILMTTQPHKFAFLALYLNYSHLHTNSALATYDPHTHCPPRCSIHHPD